jgi:hypothetical protein
MLQNVQILSCLGILSHRSVSIGIPKLHVDKFHANTNVKPAHLIILPRNNRVF